MGLSLTMSQKKNKRNLESASWSYSGFNRFRLRIAESLGIDINEMDGWKTDDGKHTGNYVKGRSWNEVKSPIKYLLNHSDCDGIIHYSKCKDIAFALKHIIKNWEDSYDKENAENLIELMKDCHLYKANLLFR